MTLPFSRITMILLFAGALVLNGCKHTQVRDTQYMYQIPAVRNDGIAVGNIYSARVDSSKIIGLTRFILSDSFPNIHSLLIARNNKLIYENYFSGEDEIWGFHLGYADHHFNTLHDVRSISKSIVSACIGIAIMNHQIKNIDDPIFNYLPSYHQYKTTLNSPITIRELLTMSSGIEWDEETPHNTSKNSESQMEKSEDPVAYTLSLPISRKPGSHWNYNSGGVQVLAAIIKKVSGYDIDAFAEKYLFHPLGIRDYQWIKSQPDFPAAASGLRLRSRDLLKIGLLYLNGGKWNGESILAESWVKESLATNILRDSNAQTGGYGYLFWTDTDTVNNQPVVLSIAKGSGGQRLFIDQQSNLIVVITAGNYHHPNIIKDGQLAFDQFILPALH